MASAERRQLQQKFEMTQTEKRRPPRPVERDFLYQLAKDAVSLWDEQTYNAARAFLWSVKWLDHKSADEIAEQASRRIIAVRDDVRTKSGKNSLAEEFAEMWPRPDRWVSSPIPF